MSDIANDFMELVLEILKLNELEGQLHDRLRA